MSVYQLFVDVSTQINPICAVVIATSEDMAMKLFSIHGGFEDFQITRIVVGATIFSQHYSVISPNANYVSNKVEYDYMWQQEE